MSHVTCIIQARSNSTRLPGKLLLKLQGRTLLERAVLQACSIFGDPNVLIAVPHYDAVIRRECDRIQRGVMVAVNCDEHDVLTRFWLAANQHGLSGLDRIARWTPDDWRKDNDLIRLAIAGKPRVSPQQSVETFAEGGERAEVVVGGGVALAPAARHLVVELAGNEVGGHAGERVHGRRKAYLKTVCRENSRTGR